jgi:hypothetical protein
MKDSLKSIIKKYTLKETDQLKKGDLVFHPFIKGEKPVKVELVDEDMVYTSDGKSTRKIHVKKVGNEIKETAGFEKKSTKETNVEEDLRNNYQTGALVPYQSVIAEGKIVGNSKIKLKEAPGSANSPEEKVYNLLFSQDFSDWYENEFMLHVEGDENALSKEDILEEIRNMLR